MTRNVRARVVSVPSIGTGEGAVRGGPLFMGRAACVRLGTVLTSRIDSPGR
ncbi:hypothetical protein [Streptomyces virginiae]|uniref:hypothetical protein n=1 Tax=Streptomyces virginiae TaxID=1961 RepID=UPI00131A94CB|nr:hypothetical protein [Streptomyces virginiae]